MKKKSVIELKRFEGTHEEMGRRQGAECSDILRHTRSMLMESEELQVIKPFFLPKGLFLKIAKRVVWNEFAAGIEKCSPRQYARLRGIAEGSGLDIRHIVFLQSMEIEMAKTHFTLGACSAAAVTAGRSATGEPIIIKNFDYPEFFSPTHLTRLDAPRDGFHVLAATNAPLAGSHDAMNEHGLSITYNYGYGQDRSSNKTPLTIALQDTLEQCRTTAEAVVFLRGYDYNGCALWIVCDAGGDLRALDISKTRIVERLPINGALMHTNHYLDAEMAKIDVPQNAYYSKKTVKAIRGTRCRESTDVRYARGIELLGKKEKVSPEDLVEIFSDHGPDGVPSDNTICRHSDYFRTTLSVIMLPASRKFLVLYGHPCEYEYTEFSF